MPVADCRPPVDEPFAGAGDSGQQAAHACDRELPHADPTGLRPARAMPSVASGYAPSPRSRSRCAAFRTPMKTYVAKPTDRERNWLVVDATGQTLGRLATQIADALRGKRKPEYTPHIDTGDFVVVVNAEKITVTGDKRQDKKYYRHSRLPGRPEGPHLRRDDGAPAGGDHPPRGQGDAAPQPPRPQAAHEAQGLRRARPPAPGAEAATDGDPASERRDAAARGRAAGRRRAGPRGRRRADRRRRAARGARRRAERARRRGARRARRGARRRGARRRGPAEEPAPRPAEEPAAEAPPPRPRRRRAPPSDDERRRRGAHAARQAGDPGHGPRGRHRRRGRRPAPPPQPYGDEDDLYDAADEQLAAADDRTPTSSRSRRSRSTSPPTPATRRPASARPRSPA